jgi:hypothetical protein
VIRSTSLFDLDYFQPMSSRRSSRRLLPLNSLNPTVQLGLDELIQPVEETASAHQNGLELR